MNPRTKPNVSPAKRQKEARGKGLGVNGRRNLAVPEQQKSEGEAVATRAIERWENEGGRAAKPGTGAKRR
jgi:hypothetical protein